MSDVDPNLHLAKQKLDALEKQLAQARTAIEPASNGDCKGHNLGVKIATEVASGLGLGLIVGYAIDQQFSTRPFGILAGVVLGLVGGLWNAFLLANKPPKKREDEI